jgi:hypothetical protein
MMTQETASTATTNGKAAKVGTARTRKKPTSTEAGKMKESSSFIDSLITNHKTATSAFSEARQRRIRLATVLIDDTIKSQKSTLELIKTVSENPTAYKDNITAMLESFMHAQSQAMSFSKLLIAEQADMREEFISTTKALIEGSQESSKAAMSLAKSWSAENPFSDAFKQSFDNMKDTASKMTASVA